MASNNCHSCNSDGSPRACSACHTIKYCNKVRDTIFAESNLTQFACCLYRNVSLSTGLKSINESVVRLRRLKIGRGEIGAHILTIGHTCMSKSARLRDYPEFSSCDFAAFQGIVHRYLM